MLKIGAIILAAGMSKRMGRSKLLLPLNGKLLFRYAVESAVRNHLTPIVVVAGNDIENLRNDTQDIQDLEIIYNPAYTEGMASSLKLGIQSVTGRVDAVIIFLADQPFVPDLVVHSLIEKYKAIHTEEICIIRPKYQGLLGHPILFDAKLFSEFNAIEGDQGGRSIIKRNSHLLSMISFQNPKWGMDIDTQEDYQKINRNHEPW